MRLPLLTLCLLATPALAQPFGFGPPGTPAGSSMSGAQIGNYRSPRAGIAIPDAPVFGDTPVERAYGRDVDDSFLRPRVPRPDADGATTHLRAAEGRSTIRPDTAGDFARSDPSVLNQSGVTRPISPPRRARIVPNPQRSR
ncbi:hypothetical protein [Aureimonas jatrophae]|uniref:Uncharacterized protein n=1 Tax=Aureimonas jatrophae TaxID=1166073 RepID=A0A1H0HNX2_9HYPH|nr:hypothetical protein [Aureimonas jatrophae]MBB3950687.1 hypothetical protein [Aureimonas jatrophae]SDO20723.1 hypothetical protein SAMN05192530_104195 [Aureimonas jatrophae]